MSNSQRGNNEQLAKGTRWSSEPRDENRLETIYDPEGGDIDIVFIHGLDDDDAEERWSRHWPRDILPEKLPNARILSYSWCSNTTASQIAITNHSRSMCAKLLVLRRKTDTLSRPLIFICYDISEVLCKEMLVNSMLSPDATIRSLSGVTIGLILLGIPRHRQDLLKEPRSDGKLVLAADHPFGIQDPPRQNMEAFPTLLQKKLRSGQPFKVFSVLDSWKYRITTFGQTLSPSIKTEEVFRGTVDDHAVDGDVGSEHILVAQALEDAIRIERRSSIEVENLAIDDNKTIPQPYPSEISIWQQKSYNRIPIGHPSSYDWLERSEQYRHWCAPSTNDEDWIRGNRLLWITGSPGSGKTMLFKDLCEKTSKTSYTSGVDHFKFLFDPNVPVLGRDRSAFLRDVLIQVNLALDSTSSTSDPTRQGLHKSYYISQRTSMVSASGELVRAFHETLASISVIKPVLLFVDALDECIGEEISLVVRDLEEMLDIVRVRGGDLRILVTSRQSTRIQFRDRIRLRLEDSRSSAIQEFLHQNIPKQFVELAPHIAKKSDGNFLYAQLWLKNLKESARRGDPDEQVAQYTEGPDNLLSLLTTIVEKEQSALDQKRRQDYVELIRCVSCSFAPVSPILVAGVLELELNNPKLDMKSLLKITNLVESLPEDPSSPCLTFVHQSVMEFFSTTDGLRSLDATESSISFASQGHANIARYCISILDMFRSSSTEPIPYALFGPSGLESLPYNELLAASIDPTLLSSICYAVENTFDHLRFANLIEMTLIERHARCLSKQDLTSALCAWILAYKWYKKRENTMNPALVRDTTLRMVTEHLKWFNLRYADIKYLEAEFKFSDRTASRMVADLKTLRRVASGEIDQNARGSGDVKFTTRIIVEVPWDVLGFVEHDFDPATRLGDIFVVIGPPESPHGLASIDYIDSRWPVMGSWVVQLLEKAKCHIFHAGKVGDSKKSFNLDRAIGKESLTVIDFSWRPSDKFGGAELASFQIEGPKELLTDFLEIIAWLTGSLRTAYQDSGLIACSDVYIEFLREAGDPILTCLIAPDALRPVKDLAQQCWHSLFNGVTIVDCPKIPSRVRRSSAPHEISSFHAFIAKCGSNLFEKLLRGSGLEVSLEHMIALTGADTVVEYGGGLVLLGYSMILVPITWLWGGGLQWHLIRATGEGERSFLWQIEDDPVCRGRTLIQSWNAVTTAPRHFLGLWSSVLVVLGTEKAEYSNVVRSRFQEKKWTSFPLSQSIGASFGMRGLSMSTSKTIAIARTQIRTNPEEQKTAQLLKDFSRETVVLYDPESEKRAWLVPKLSVILHAAHLCSDQQGCPSKIPFAEASSDGNLAALEAFRNLGNVELYHISDDPKENFTTTDVVRRIATNVRRMEIKPGSRLCWKRIVGYDFTDLVKSPDVKLLKTNREWWPRRDGWKFFATKVPILICKDLGELVTPVHKEQHCFGTGQDHLLAPISCLESVVDDGWASLEEGRLGKDWYWHSPHSPFGQCHCDLDGEIRPRSSDCNHLQYVINKKRLAKPWSKMKECRDGAVVIAKYQNKVCKTRVIAHLSTTTEAHGTVLRPSNDAHMHSDTDDEALVNRDEVAVGDAVSDEEDTEGISQFGIMAVLERMIEVRIYLIYCASIGPILITIMALAWAVVSG